jgi:hypothetical protein
MIPTAFVVVSFSRSAMNKLFSTGATFKDLLKESETNDDVFLFNNAGNANFVKLEHTNGKGAVMKIEVIDPEQTFEQRLVSNNITDLASAYASDIKQSESPVIDVNDSTDYKEQVQQNKQFFEEYTEALKQKNKKFQLYVAYGVGENLGAWSGPHIVEIGGVDISVKGSRRFMLDLTVVGGRFNSEQRKRVSRADIDLNLEGLQTKITAKSSPFNFLDIAEESFKNKKRTKKLHEPYYGGSTYKDNIEYYRKDYLKNFDDDVKNYKGPGGNPSDGYYAFKQTYDLQEELDIHMVVTECMRKYIQISTGNPNVIVLLPDLNVLLRDYMKSKITQTLTDETLVGPSMSPISDNSFNSYVQMQKSASNLLDQYDRSLSIFSGLGMRVKAQFKDGRKSNNPNVMTEREKNYETVEDRAIAFFNKRTFYASIDSGWKSSFAKAATQTVLNKVIDKILAAIKGVDYGDWNNVTYFETDSKFLELWSREKGNPVFNSIEKKFDPDKPAIIFGHSGLIQNLLYAEDPEEIQYQGPIHPVERFALGPGYQKRARAITDARLDASISGPFGETTFVPDEFMYMDENQAASEVLKKLVKKKRLSVFRYNVQNSNVLDLKLQFSPIYFSELRGTFMKQVDKRSVAAVEGVIDSKYSLFDLPTPEATIAYIRSRQNTLGDSEESRKKILQELQSKDLTQAFVGDTAEENAKLAYAMYDRLLNRDDQPLIKLDQELPGDPVKVVGNMAQRLAKAAITLSINTLPAFHESAMNLVRRPVLLLASDRPIKQTSPPDQSILDTFFSGLYYITGFKHSISAGKASSEFSLQRVVTPTKKPEETSGDSLELEKPS